jgi:PAS domain S-box-containing protein
MIQKPTYEELELKIKELEKEISNTCKARHITRDEGGNYKRFIKFLPYPVLVRDAKGFVTYLNPAFTKTFGWNLIDLKGKSGRQYVPRALENEVADRIKGLPIHKNEFRLRTKRLTKEGKLLDVMLRIGVEKDHNNNPAGAIIVFRDVTMENRNKRNRNAMNRICQALPQYPDLRKLLFYINTEIKELLQTESTTTILLDDTKNEFYLLSAVHDDPATRERMENARFSVDELLSGKVIQTGEPMIVNNFSDIQHQYKSRDQAIGYTVKNAICVPLKNKKHVFGVLASDNKKTGFFDETDLETLNTIASTVALSIENARVSRELRKAYEELKSLNNAKDKMINHLAHELKTPVAILISSFKILSKKLVALPEKIWQPTMERIYRNLDRIIGIGDEVYDIVERKEVFHHQLFSLILEQSKDEFEALIAEETGETGVIAKVRQKIEDIFSTRDLVVQNIFLDEFVAERVDAVKKHMAHRDITLTTRLKSSFPIQIPAEPLQKTVDGLIQNAIENSPDGGEIEILVRQKGKGMQFIVKDHGIGLTEEVQKRIFEGFFTTQDTMDYSSKRPFDFNAGGKGADLLRMKIFSERYNFNISMTSERCQCILENKDICPGSIQECRKLKKSPCSGMTTVTCFFPFH